MRLADSGMTEPLLIIGAEEGRGVITSPHPLVLPAWCSVPQPSQATASRLASFRQAR